MKRYPSFILVVFIVLTSFCVSTQADIITLKNANQDVELKVLGVFDEHISAAIPGKAIKTLVKQFSDVKSYPDVLFMISPGVTIVCRVKEVTEDTVQILIPTSIISSLKMGFQPVVKPETDVPVSRISDKPKDVVGDVKTSLQAKTGSEKNSRLQTKPLNDEDVVTKERLSARNIEGESAAGVKREAPLEDTSARKPEGKTFGIAPKSEKEASDKVENVASHETKNMRMPVVQDSKPGNVEGKIFQNGKPLKNCQVKLILMEKVGFLTKEYHTVEGASEIESVTDDHGVYHFASIPPGQYKMYWMPSSETGWVRRLKMDPDVVVESGKRVTPKDIEITKRTLN
ncbi:MAG: hypothetical protein AABY76_04025 [Planctomycetota bacterium]